MTTGMATVAGSVMIALVSILDMKFEGINLIQHFLIASILSVPAAIVYANIMIPSNHITDFESSETPRVYESTMDAITRGTSDGMNIALSVGSIVLAFIALVFIADSILGLIPISLGGEDLSLKLILGYMFAPIAWMMGIPWDEALISGKLLGTKTALNEFVAYLDLAALSEGALSDRSRLITLYGLCGFANFSSIGILVAGISAMAPEKKPELIEVSLKALVGATLASCMTGLVLSLFI
jgi:CNT family concentrative nucleoside transporter